MAILNAEYTYNGIGERVIKTRYQADGTRRIFHFHYDRNGQLLAETKYDNPTENV